MTYLITTQAILDKDKILEILASLYPSKIMQIGQIQTYTPNNLVYDLKETKKMIVLESESKKDLGSQIVELYQKNDKVIFVVFDYLENISIAAQESLLKFLEEPPTNVVSILLAKSSNNILETILSRSSVLTLNSSLILQILDSKMLETTQKYLPKPKEFINSWLENKASLADFGDLKNLERADIDFWLWQVLYYLQNFYKQNLDLNLAKKIFKIEQSLKYNSSNLQKKFVFANLIS